MGNGKLAISVYKLIENVFLSKRQNSCDWKKRSNWANPTHGLPLIPFVTLNSLNAICAPYIGTYLKMMMYNNGSKKARTIASCG